MVTKEEKKKKEEGKEIQELRQKRFNPETRKTTIRRTLQKEVKPGKTKQVVRSRVIPESLELTSRALGRDPIGFKPNLSIFDAPDVLKSNIRKGVLPQGFESLSPEQQQSLIEANARNLELLNLPPETIQQIQEARIRENEAREELARDRRSREQVRQPTAEGGLPAGISPVEQFQLEQAGAFEQVGLQRDELSPERTLGEGIPLIGPGIAAIKEGIAQAFPAIKGRKALTGETAFQAPETPESIREEALRLISQEAFNEGISASEAVGTVIEGIPILGSAAAKFAGGLTQTPSSNANEVVAQIRSERERAATSAEKVRNGLIRPSDGLENVRIMEENMAELKGRLKLLISTSPILRANSDEVNRIEQEILRADERISQFRAASQFALTAEFAGTRNVPPDEQIFLELQDRINKKQNI